MKLIGIDDYYTATAACKAYNAGAEHLGLCQIEDNIGASASSADLDKAEDAFNTVVGAATHLLRWGLLLAGVANKIVHQRPEIVNSDRDSEVYAKDLVSLLRATRSLGEVLDTIN